MSTETAQRVAQAEAFASEQRAQADKQIAECLSGIASGLPGRIDDVAKRTAHNQPDVARSLGTDGVNVLRRELADAAQQLGSELEGSADEIRWPQASGVTRIDYRQIHEALSAFLTGPRLDGIAAVFRRHGFSAGSRSGPSQTLVLPQDLYDQTSFIPVAAALSLLGTAELSLASAKADDDRATVDSLWDDSKLEG
jgi:hypothetical protein